MNDFFENEWNFYSMNEIQGYVVSLQVPNMGLEV